MVVGMKKQVLVVHGGSAFSKYDDFLRSLREGPFRNIYGAKPKRWRESLALTLCEDWEVFTPSMPNAENAQYTEWSIWFERHFSYLNDGVTLVGWSLGGMFLVKYLLEKPIPFTVQRLVLLGTPCGEYSDASGDDCGTFRFKPKDISVLTAKVADIQIWHSEDDFVVPYSHALEFKKYLPESQLVTFTDRNHFLQEEFPELIETIKQVE
jgi:pimeloyl-ACP methyl ester carboxylesterase